MTLKEWMDREEKTQDWVALQLCCDQAHVSRLCTGKAVGSPTTIVRIGEMTNGDVTLEDMVRANAEAVKAA